MESFQWYHYILLTLLIIISFIIVLHEFKNLWNNREEIGKKHSNIKKGNSLTND